MVRSGGGEVVSLVVRFDLHWRLCFGGGLVEPCHGVVTSRKHGFVTFLYDLACGVC